MAARAGEENMSSSVVTPKARAWIGVPGKECV
jgi:hypothetical protein